MSFEPPCERNNQNLLEEIKSKVELLRGDFHDFGFSLSNPDKRGVVTLGVYKLTDYTSLDGLKGAVKELNENGFDVSGISEGIDQEADILRAFLTDGNMGEADNGVPFDEKGISGIKFGKNAIDHIHFSSERNEKAFKFGDLSDSYNMQIVRNLSTRIEKVKNKQVRIPVQTIVRSTLADIATENKLKDQNNYIDQLPSVG